MSVYEILGIDLTSNEKEKLEKILDSKKLKLITSDKDGVYNDECESPYLVIIPWRTWKMYSKEELDDKVIHIKHTQNGNLKDINLLSECVLGISSELLDNKDEMKKLLESAQGLNKFITKITRENELYKELYLKKSENLDFLEEFFQIVRSNEFDIVTMLNSVYYLMYQTFKISNLCLAIKQPDKWTVYSTNKSFADFICEKNNLNANIRFIKICINDADNNSFNFVYEAHTDVPNSLFYMSFLNENLGEDEYKVIDIAANHLCYVINWIIKFQKLSDFAYKDPLTEVGNRHYFDMVLQHEIKRHKRLSSAFSIIIMDIDNFKQINDTYGHHVGDLILKNLAKKLKNRIREIDHIIRFGGEEFLILLPHTDKKDAHILATRLKDIIENSIFIADGVKLRITVSMGISQFNPSHDSDINLAIKMADEALYKAKKDGKNRAYVA